LPRTTAAFHRSRGAKAAACAEARGAASARAVTSQKHSRITFKYKEALGILVISCST